MIKVENRRPLAAAGLIVFIGAATAVPATAQPAARPPEIQKVTQNARNILAMGQAKAKQLHQGEMGIEFVLWALVSDRQGVAAHMLQKMDVPIDAIRLQAEAEMVWSTDANPPPEVAEPKLSAGVLHVLEFAADEAKRLPGDNKDIKSEHLLLGLLRQKEDLPFSYTILRKAGVTIEKARQQIGREQQ